MFDISDYLKESIEKYHAYCEAYLRARYTREELIEAVGQGRVCHQGYMGGHPLAESVVQDLIVDGTIVARLCKPSTEIW